MSGLILRLAGPMQSWGEHSTFGERDTAAFPTRSGLVGLLAAAEGVSRDASLADYEPLVFTVRIDRAGRHIVDDHTVGGGYPRTHTIMTAEGKRRPEGAGTLVSHRHYLADAVFTVGVTTADEHAQLLPRLAAALSRPVWAPYLGRRSCVPDQPMLLRTDVDDVFTELSQRTPIPRDGEEPRRVDFILEQPRAEDEAPFYELLDVPVSFARLDRRYRSRRVFRRNELVSAPTYKVGDHQPLLDYARGEQR